MTTCEAVLMSHFDELTNVQLFSAMHHYSTWYGWATIRHRWSASLLSLRWHHSILAVLRRWKITGARRAAGARPTHLLRRWPTHHLNLHPWLLLRRHPRIELHRSRYGCYRRSW